MEIFVLAYQTVQLVCHGHRVYFRKLMVVRYCFASRLVILSRERDSNEARTNYKIISVFSKPASHIESNHEASFPSTIYSPLLPCLNIP